LARKVPAQFAEPLELPHGLIDESQGPITTAARATFSFDVTTRGRVRDINEVSSTEGRRDAIRIKKNLRELRFRPALDAPVSE
jgi:hypothetical protein